MMKYQELINIQRTNLETLIVYNNDIKEEDSLIGKWMTINEIADNYNKLENWSKYLIDYLLENKI